MPESIYLYSSTPLVAFFHSAHVHGLHDRLTISVNFLHYASKLYPRKFFNICHLLIEIIYRCPNLKPIQENSLCFVMYLQYAQALFNDFKYCLIGPFSYEKEAILYNLLTQVAHL